MKESIYSSHSAHIYLSIYLSDSYLSITQIKSKINLCIRLSDIVPFYLFRKERKSNYRGTKTIKMLICYYINKIYQWELQQSLPISAVFSRLNILVVQSW